MAKAFQGFHRLWLRHCGTFNKERELLCKQQQATKQSNYNKWTITRSRADDTPSYQHAMDRWTFDFVSLFSFLKFILLVINNYQIIFLKIPLFILLSNGFWRGKKCSTRDGAQELSRLILKKKKICSRRNNKAKRRKHCLARFRSWL